MLVAFKYSCTISEFCNPCSCRMIRTSGIHHFIDNLEKENTSCLRDLHENKNMYNIYMLYEYIYIQYESLTGLNPPPFLWLLNTFVNYLRNNNREIEITLHSNPISWLRANQSLLLILNALDFAKKQQMQILKSFCWLWIVKWQAYKSC